MRLSEALSHAQGRARPPPVGKRQVELAPAKRLHPVESRALHPDQILAAISFEFDDAGTALQIEQMVANIEARIQDEHPVVTSLSIKRKSLAQFTRSVRTRYDDQAAAEILAHASGEAAGASLLQHEGDLGRRFRRATGEVAHFGGDHGEAATPFARTRRLDRGVEG